MPTRVNYCTNPSAETNTNGWSATNSSISRTSGSPTSGDYEFTVTRTAETGWMLMVPLTATGNRPIVSPGETWTCSADIMSADALPVTAAIKWLTSEGATVSTVEKTISATPSPQRVVVSGIAPETAEVLRFDFTHKANGAIGESFVVDSVLMTPGEFSSYFDGDSPNAEWTGTPHASTSVLTIPDTAPRTILTPGPRPITMLTPH